MAHGPFDNDDEAHRYYVREGEIAIRVYMERNSDDIPADDIRRPLNNGGKIANEIRNQLGTTEGLPANGKVELKGIEIFDDDTFWAGYTRANILITWRS